MSKLLNVRSNALKIPINSHSKIAIMSDCHRGTGSWTDNFLKNRHIFSAALFQYLSGNFTYIELGDGDELWENSHFPAIKEAHSEIFQIMNEFHKKNMLFMIYGNHDMKKRCCNIGFNNFKCHEGILLEGCGNSIFLVHGHQADFINSTLWPISKFLVRYLWRPLETVGISDPTSAAKNYEKKNIIEKKLSNWSRTNNQMTICGHTHRPVLPLPGSSLYCNCGSCVHPYSVTALEIENSSISLVKWSVKSDLFGTLYAGKETISGPFKLSLFR